MLLRHARPVSNCGSTAVRCTTPVMFRTVCCIRFLFGIFTAFLMACDNWQLAYSIMLRSKARYIPVYYLVCSCYNYDAILLYTGEFCWHILSPIRTLNWISLQWVFRSFDTYLLNFTFLSTGLFFWGGGILVILCLRLSRVYCEKPQLVVVFKSWNVVVRLTT